MLDTGSILNVLWAEGFTVELGPGDKLLVGPASALSDHHREILRANKAAIVELLISERRNAEAETAELIAAAMRACDHCGDGHEARAEMERDIRATPAHLRADLLEHFQKNYGAQP